MTIEEWEADIKAEMERLKPICRALPDGKKKYNTDDERKEAIKQQKKAYKVRKAMEELALLQIKGGNNLTTQEKKRRASLYVTLAYYRKAA